MSYYKIIKATVLALSLLFLNNSVYAQNILSDFSYNTKDVDSIRAELDKGATFTAFKDNSGLIGTTIGSKPTSTNSDAKFQLSIMQRFTNSNLLWNSHFFFQLTVSTFLNVFEPSFPLHDMSINPGFGFNKYLFKDGKYVGQGYVMLEHESNGFDSIQSRSWNKISAAATVQMTRNWEFQAKGWIPIVDGRYSQDILQYMGLFYVGSTFSTNNKRLNLSVMLTPTYRKRLGINSQCELNFRVMKKQPVYAIIQYYNGYGENLLDYNIYKSRLRIGFAFKPRDFNRF
ncbi:phospholipase A [Massilibacteroides sp.]|uniref:phospholipase A n=1 Tax=Massilibacteroides sp. TaxID=2034766 RepID=UPI002629C26F|nr:phospholipase A [Massilibacteroides sp.]MDD4514115.1 phospholipase A [Massilibacteroides sp.]